MEKGNYALKRVFNEGTGLRNGEHLVVCDGEAVFEEALLMLLKDERRAAQYVAQGQAFLCKVYNQQEALTLCFGEETS